MEGTRERAKRLKWVHEPAPRWDAAKVDVIGGAPTGALAEMRYREGDVLPGDWWHVEEDGRVVGYGWMDTVWGDAEILLAVAPDRRKFGVGTFILDRLEDEARGRGINYVYNVVRKEHPDRRTLTRWLEQRGFAHSEGGHLRRRVTPARPEGGADPEPH